MNKKYILLISAILSSLFLSTCGNPGSEESSGTGSLSFKLIWQGAPTLSSDSKPEDSDSMGVREAAIDCTASGVSTVEASIYNSSGTLLASGGPWSCSAHSGTISSISAGTSRTAVISGKDSSGNTIYKGEETGITITSDQITTSTVTLSPSPVNLSSGLNSPLRVAVDSTNIYWTENNSSGTVKKVSISGGTVTTLASGLSNPADIAVDSTNIYWTEDTTVKKVSISGGTATTLASGLSSPDNIAVDSSNVYWTEFTATGTVKKVSISGGTVTTLASGLNKPWDIAVDSANVYWTENNDSGTVKKVSISGGTATTLASGLNYPAGIAVDSTNIYWTIYSSTNGTINRIVKGETIAVSDTTALMGGSMQGTSLNLTSTNAAVTTFAGSAGSSGSTDATGSSARFNSPHSITTDGTNLYVTDQDNHIVRKIVISTGVVTTIAGSAGSSGSTDATGSSARFYTPRGITTDGTNLYVVDSWNYTIRKIVISTGVVTTIAGSAGLSGSTDGTGTSARFNGPFGITTNGTNLFVTDTDNHTIRKIVISTGVVTTIAGSAGSSGSTDGTGTSARFNYPGGITTDGTNLFIADFSNYTIRKIVISTGVVTTLAGSAGTSGSTDATGTSARFYN